MNSFRGALITDDIVRCWSYFRETTLCPASRIAICVGFIKVVIEWNRVESGRSRGMWSCCYCSSLRSKWLSTNSIRSDWITIGFSQFIVIPLDPFNAIRFFALSSFIYFDCSHRSLAQRLSTKKQQHWKPRKSIKVYLESEMFQSVLCFVKCLR